MPSPRAPPAELARRAAMTRFWSTAGVRVSTWPQKSRVKRPVPVREAAKAQVKAVMNALPEKERVIFLKEYVRRVRDNMRALERAEAIFQKYVSEKKRTTNQRAARVVYDDFRSQLVDSIGRERAESVLIDLRKAKLIPDYSKQGKYFTLDAATTEVLKLKNKITPILGSKKIFEENLFELASRVQNFDPSKGYPLEKYIRAMARNLRLDIREAKLGTTKSGRDERIGKYVESTADGEDALGDSIIDLKPARERERFDWVEAIRLAKRKLSPTQVMVLELYYQEGLSFREIGKMLKLSESRVTKLEKESRHILQEKLRKYFE